MSKAICILAFAVGMRRRLVAGGPRSENWSCARGQGTHRNSLESVDLNKVSYHRSCSVPRESLYASHKRRDAKPTPKRLKSLLSGMAATQGDENSRTEVPRRTPLGAVREESSIAPPATVKGEKPRHSWVITLSIRPETLQTSMTDPRPQHISGCGHPPDSGWSRVSQGRLSCTDAKREPGMRQAMTSPLVPIRSSPTETGFTPYKHDPSHYFPLNPEHRDPWSS